MAEEEDPYAVSSDSEDEGARKPPPKIQIEGRQNADINQLKTALTESKEVTKDEAMKEELEQLKQARDTKKMKEDFESGAVSSKTTEEVNEAKAALEEERQKLTEISKEKYSKFKDKFEHIENTLEENLEERMKRMEREMIGLGKETLASAKEKFEKGEGDVSVEKTQVEIERSADMKKMKAAFNRQEMTADEAPKECAVCGKVVYPVERVFANKQLYHIQCFKCCKCEKKLIPTNFNSHEGKLLCKVHMLEVFHPELAKTMDPANTEEDDHGANSDDDEFAVSSKPKQLQGVVKSGATAVHEELAQIRSLKEKKGDFESSIKEAATVEKKTKVEDDLLQAGRVKANTERFVSGAALQGDEEEEVEEGERDPNIIREDKKKKKEELHFDQIGDIKNKWKTGEVETAEQKEASERKELEALKGGPSVKERFQEKQEAESVVERTWDKNELDTKAAAEARKSFMEGAAYQATNPVEKTVGDLGDLQFSHLKGFKEKFEKGESEVEVQKTAVDVDVQQIGNIKAAFEKPEDEMTPEERAALKKKEIEAEFLKYKLARRAAAERAKQQESEGQAPVVTAGGEADVGSIKDRFDKGEAFKGEGLDEKKLDVEFKIAGKAREKFQQIDASGAQPVMPGQNKKAEPSKWDKKDDKPVAEIINRRDRNSPEAPEEEEEFDVKNLMNKFKSIGEGAGSSAVNSEQRAELEALKRETKNVKQRFEQPSDDSADVVEEKRKQMQEEMERMKREREEAQKRLEEERAQEQSERAIDKEDVDIKADHASKMAAKWEKIHAKEAKKAEKGRMPEKKTVTKFVMKSQPKCSVCSTSVYVAEQFQCFGILYHTRCFRCLVCRQALRVEKVHRNKDGDLFCPVHFKVCQVNGGKIPVQMEENNNEAMEERSHA